MLHTNTRNKELLRKEFKKGNIVLYLGAGVSVDNNIPSWDKLVLSMYFSAISKEYLGGWRPFSNYLYAISEWYLKNSNEPLEITARKLRDFYQSGHQTNSFTEALYETLYGGLLDQVNDSPGVIDHNYLCTRNSTLASLHKMCLPDAKGINSVITYNYDSLLEIALEDVPSQSIYRNDQTLNASLPVYHVHGYVPLDSNTEGSAEDDIVFTEDQYHRVAGNPYYWSNLVQIKSMSNSTGLMVGLSLSDRNMRRLLDAVGRAPFHSTNFAILKAPDTSPPKDEVLDEIHRNAIQYYHNFIDSGIKSDDFYDRSIFTQRLGVKSGRPDIKSSRMGEKGPVYRNEISAILEQVKIRDLEKQENVLKQLGIIPIWVESFEKIPELINEIFF